MTHAMEQRIGVFQAELCQRGAHRGLAHAQMLRSQRNAAVFVDGHQHGEQVQVELAAHDAISLPEISDIQSTRLKITRFPPTVTGF